MTRPFSHGSGGCASGFPAGIVEPAEREGRPVRRYALRMDKAFGVKMDTLMRMQSSYDIAQTRKREKEIRVRRFQPAESQP